MLPIAALQSCRAHELPFGAFAWLTSGDQETLIIANEAKPYAVVFGANSHVSMMHDLDGDALYTTNWQIEVDPTSAKGSTQADSAFGLLVVTKSSTNVMIKFNEASQWSYASIPMPNDSSVKMQTGMAFSRWKIVTMVGDKQHVLFEMPSQ